MLDLSVLNKEQKEAVEYNNGPLLIVAGAGSGKTRVITYKIAYLLENGAYPNEILAITFTNKAAAEMSKRTKELTNINEFIQISTFHSFGSKILRQFAGRVGYNTNFSVYDYDDGKRIINEAVKNLFPDIDLKVTDKYKALFLLSDISKCKRHYLFPHDIDKIPDRWISLSKDNNYWVNFFKIYEEYEKKLHLYNAIDLDDMIMLTVKVLEENKDIAQSVKDHYKYIFIDEYQDTDPLQFRLVKCITDNNSHITVVGDEDQSIYKFRGADITNIMTFDKTFPTAKKIILNQNYRSTTYILDGANSVIKNNPRVTDKHLWSDLGKGNKITYTKYYSDRDEAADVIDKIMTIKDYKNTAILYRSNYLSRKFEEQLRKNNIPYSVKDGVGFYEREEIKDMLSYLRLIVNPTDMESFSRIINKPKRGIGKAVIDKIVANSKNGNLIESINDIDNIKVSSKVKESLNNFINTLNELQNKTTISDMINCIWDNLYENYLDEEYGNQDKKSFDDVKLVLKRENIEELKSVAGEFIENYIEKHPELTEDEKTKLKYHDADKLTDFINDLSLNIPTEAKEDIDDKVYLMTLHSAKGLEFEHIFIVCMNDGIFPHAPSEIEFNYLSDEEKENAKRELEEERRLCYVGITRAKKDLFLSTYMDGFVFNEHKIYKPSRFLDELNKSTFVSYDKTKNFLNMEI